MSSTNFDDDVDDDEDDDAGKNFQTEPEDLSRRKSDLVDEDEKENNVDDLDVSTSSDRVSATATVSSTTDPAAILTNPILNKMPIVNK